VSARQVILNPGELLELKLPGGGGYGDPYARDFRLIEEDLRNGLISAEHARSSYGVLTDASGWKIDIAGSESLRRAIRKDGTAA
jgi:N-methylhydantoinase B/oxoprolinase/acetone carboxylase alpha subunit